MGELPDSTSEDAKHLKEQYNKVETLCKEAKMILNDTWFVFINICKFYIYYKKCFCFLKFIKLNCIL